jgi:hypothetical protein
LLKNNIKSIILVNEKNGDYYYSYLKDAFTNSDLVEAHTIQYLILYLVLYSTDVGFLEMDKQIRWETKI